MLTLMSCQDKAFQIYGETQGTTYYIKYFAKKELIQKQDIDSILRHFDLSVSTYISESIISQLNSGNVGIELDDFFVDNFNISKSIYHDTDGLFDPTIGTLVNAYGFGPKKQPINITPKVIDSLLTMVGMDKVTIQNNKLIKSNPNIYIDFNAIAQGYSVDVLVNYLIEKGVEHAIVEIGGEIFAYGDNLEKKQAWVVGIENPTTTDEQREVLAKIELKELGLATSGNYRKIKTDSVTGKRFVHIINPKTGLSEKTNILSVTVLAKTTAKADAYATALMLMDINTIKNFVKSRKELFVFVVYEEDNDTKHWYSENLKVLLKH